MKNHDTRYKIQEAGFTLVELMVVITIIGILVTVGFASYHSFRQSQTLKAVAADLKNNLRFVQSKALAQEKPATGCTVLDGYQVDIGVGTRNYSYAALCNGGADLISSRSFPSLPAGVTFSSAIPSQIVFRILGSGATDATITISGFGRNIDVTLTKPGEIYSGNVY